MIRVWIHLLVFLLLIACGNTAPGPVVEALQNALRPAESVAAGTLAQQRAAILQDVKNSGVEGPVLLVTLESRQVIAALVPVGSNADATTWLDKSGVSIVTHAGVVTSTRGLGFDVIASDVSGLLASQFLTQTTYTRAFRLLDGSAKLNWVKTQCRSSRSNNVLLETCDTVSFSNKYVFKNNEIWSSRQWLGAEIGYANLERLQ